MRLAKVTQNGAVGLAVDTGAGVKALFGDAALYDLDALIASGGSALTDAGAKVSAEGEEVQVEDLTFLPPLVKAPKILCLGLNYKDHAVEGSSPCPNSRRYSKPFQFEPDRPWRTDHQTALFRSTRL